MYSILAIIGGVASLAAASVSSAPVCIVGTGPAGLTAAHEVEAKGRSVVLFDKQALVGGKCQSYYDSTYHPLGALLFTNGTYMESLKIIRNTTVKARQFDDGVPRWSYDWRNGTIAPYPSFTPEEIVLLGAEILRYNLFWATSFAPISAVGYPKPIPPALTVSTLEWCNENGYKVLPVLFNLAMFAYGYGDLRQTPILYMLQYFHPDVVAAFANIAPSYIIDFHAVFVQYSKGIRGPIRLNTTITKINRSGASPVITYRNPGSQQQQQQACSSLILAFPPTVSALSAANLDITPAERTLFSQVGLTNYFSGAVSTVIPANQLYYANSSTPLLPPEAAGEPVGILRTSNRSAVATTWSWGAFGQTYTLQQARDLLISTLSRINKADPANAASAAAVPVTSADVKAFRAHDYFPRVSGAQLAAGWYGNFSRIQGQKRTYYASGLNAFETVEFAVRAGQDIVRKYL